jgi:hypothetical protein
MAISGKLVAPVININSISQKHNKNQSAFRRLIVGEAKRRKLLDPNFGKVRQPRKISSVDLEALQNYLDLPLSEYTNPENEALVEKGFEQFYLFAKEAGVKMPPLPTDPSEKQRFLARFKQGMANSQLQLPDGRIVE